MHKLRKCNCERERERERGDGCMEPYIDGPFRRVSTMPALSPLLLSRSSKDQERVIALL